MGRGNRAHKGGTWFAGVAAIILLASGTAVATSDGRQLYDAYCAACHGFLLPPSFGDLLLPHVVTCPSTKEPAALELVVHAPRVFSNSRVPPPRVRRCSRWPEHLQCSQVCLRQLDSAVGTTSQRRHTTASPAISACPQWPIERAGTSGATLREVLEAVEVGIEMGGCPSRLSSARARFPR